MNYALFALIIAFAVAAAIGPFVIKALRRLKVGGKVLEIGPKWHMNKKNVPIMGGFIFIIAIIAAMAIMYPLLGRGGDARFLIVLGMGLTSGVIGFIDDYAKVKKKRNKGLGVMQKLLLQLALAILFITLMRVYGIVTPTLAIPFTSVVWELPWIVYYVFMAFAFVAINNAANFTDGLDGHAGSVTALMMIFFAVVGLFLADTADVSVYKLALLAVVSVGALLGYLIYNFYPAKVWMGDTGSLFLGGMVSGFAFAYNMPLVLLLVGLVYLIEDLSVVIQVGYFKLSGGKRVFKMAPIHHHFELSGWKEKKIGWVFSLVNLLGVTLALAAVWFGLKAFLVY